MRSLASLVAVASMATLAGCAAVVDDDFDRYAATPTHCDPAQPLDADERAFLRCTNARTCLMATWGGESSTSEAHCFPLAN